jgi:general secretion pathway protein J
VRATLRKAARGFTLIELMVALFITAIMAALGYAVLQQGLKSRVEVEQQAARLLAVQQTLRIMEQDFELLQPRPVRDLLGNGYVPALYIPQGSLGTSLSTQLASSSVNSSSNVSADASTLPITTMALSQAGLALITLTRGGWSNPIGLRRPELQRVSYQLRAGHLFRQNLPVLDGTGTTNVIERDLLDQVDGLSFRYLDAGYNWDTTWPPPTLGSANATVSLAQMRQRPIAVEITLLLHDWGTLVCIVEIPG